MFNEKLPHVAWRKNHGKSASARRTPPTIRHAAGSRRVPFVLLAAALAASCGVDGERNLAASPLVFTPGSGDPITFPGGLPTPDFDLPMPTDGLVDTQEVGTIDGSLGVSAAGQATYSVPLVVPPGRGSVTPQLALHYDSASAQNGPLGVGWSLGGLSAVARCGQTQYRDGETRGIRFDGEDPLCLDGERLVAIEGHETRYGGDGAEYRTERDRFARVRSFGAVEGGPERFVVWGRDGLIRRYDQRVVAVTTNPSNPAGTAAPLESRRATYRWLLTEVSDRTGNSARYHYDVRTVDTGLFGVEVTLTSISYTHLTASGTEVGSARREIRFVYEESRPDPVEWFIAGARFRMTQRLASVEMYAPNPTTTGLVWYYDLDYQTDVSSSRSLLLSVARCDGRDRCLPATTFTWERGNTRYETIGTGIRDGSDVYREMSAQLADFNGDGMDDLLYWDGEMGECQCSDRACDDRRWRGGAHAGNRCPQELNVSVTGEWRIALSTGRGLAAPTGTGLRTDFMTTWEDRSGVPGDPDVPGESIAFDDSMSDEYAAPIVGDLNGDGYADILTARTGSILLGPDLRETSAPVGSTYQDAAPDKEPDARYLGDFNGDGLVDLITHTNRGGGAPEDFDWIWRPGVADSSQMFGSRVDLSVHPFYEHERVDFRLANTVHDFDGDGRDEFMFPLNATTYRRLRAADDGGMEVAGINIEGDWRGALTSEPWRPLPRFGDINGDGLPDLLDLAGVAGADGTLRMRVRLNTGAGFARWESVTPIGEAYAPPVAVRPLSARQWVGGAYAPVPDDGVRVFDSNRDGRMDLLVPTATGTALYVSDGRFMRRTEPGLAITPPVTVTYTPARGSRIGFSYSDEVVLPDRDNVPIGYSHRLGDIDGNGLPDLVQYDAGRDEWVILRRLGALPARITAVQDGLGRRDTISYTTLTDRRAYSPGAPSAYPLTIARGRAPVVRAVYRDDGRGGYHGTSYEYSRALIDQRGAGLLGFETVRETDNATGAVRTRVFAPPTSERDRYVRSGLPTSDTVITPLEGGRYHVMSSQFDYWPTRWRGDRRIYSVLLRTETQREYETRSPDGAWLGRDRAAGDRVSTTYREYDDFANERYRRQWTTGTEVVHGISTTRFGSAQMRVSTYINDAENWLLGLVETRAVTGERAPSRRADDPRRGSLTEATRQYRYAYDEHGRVRAIATDLGTPDELNTTVDSRDAFGNPTVVTIASTARDPGGEQLRTMELRFDTEGQSPISSEDALGRITRFAFHPANGLLLLSRDPNRLSMRQRFDRLGRLRERTLPGAPTSYTDYLRGDGTAARAMIVWTHQDGHDERWIALDRLARVTRESSRAFDGRTRATDRTYDEAGRLERVSIPYYEGATGRDWTRTEYDALGRIVATTTPDGTRRTSEYRLFSISSTNARGHTRTDWLDVDGQVIESEEPAPGGRRIRTYFGYDAHGSTAWIRDPVGNHTIMRRDARARIVAYTDPDGGQRTYVYDAFDGISTATDPSRPLTPTRYRRDLLGRAYEVTDFEGTSRYYWDAPVEGGTGRVLYGALHGSTSVDGTQTRAFFDANGRVSAEEVRVSGERMRMEYGYDSLGRLETIRYPESGVAPMSVRYHYRAYGWIDHIDEVSSTTRTLWTATERDAAGRLRAERAGNGAVTTRLVDERTGLLTRVTTRATTRLDGGFSLFTTPLDLTYGYDPDGNLTDRMQGTSFRVEHFELDELNRMDWWTVTTGGRTQTVDYGYDDIGNLTAVNTRRPDGTSVAETFVPSTRPHTVDGYVRDEGGVRTTAQFSHDAGGRRDIDWGGRRIAYTDRDLPRTVDSVTFAYTADGVRAARSGYDYRATYLGQFYEHIRRGASNDHVYTIVGPDGPVAQVVHGAAASTPTRLYFHRDLHGTPSAITSDTGRTVAEQRFDPTGGRVDVAGAPVAGGVSATRVGFTGHAQEDSLGLVDMGGRFYDPRSRRFLSIDPLAAPHGGSQRWNPYSYVSYNPGRVDPTGFGEDDPEPTPNPTFDERPTLADVLAGFEVDRLPGGWLAATRPDAEETCEGDCTMGGTVVYGPRPMTRTDFEVDDDGYVRPDHFESEVAREYYDAGYRDWALIAEDMGGCVACHITHEPGRIPYDGEIDHERLQETAVLMRRARELVEGGVMMWAGEAVAIEIAAQMLEARSVRAALSLGDDALALNGRHVPPVSDGYYNVVMHSDGVRAAYEVSGTTVWVDHRVLARLIRSRPDYAGQPIRLIACEAGASGHGLAQRLANQMGVEVRAPVSAAYVTDTGFFYSYGNWAQFNPGVW